MSITIKESENRERVKEIKRIEDVENACCDGKIFAEENFRGIADSHTKVADGCSAVRQGQDEVAIYFCSFRQVSALSSREDKPTIRSDRVLCLASAGKLSFLHNFSS
jgi:hypothetical protein